MCMIKKNSCIYIFFFNEQSQVKFLFGINIDVMAVVESFFILLYWETHLNLTSFKDDQEARTNKFNLAMYHNIWIQHLCIQIYG